MRSRTVKQPLERELKRLPPRSLSLSLSPMAMFSGRHETYKHQEAKRQHIIINIGRAGRSVCAPNVHVLSYVPHPLKIGCKQGTNVRLLHTGLYICNQLMPRASSDRRNQPHCAAQYQQWTCRQMTRAPAVAGDDEARAKILACRFLLWP